MTDSSHLDIHVLVRTFVTILVAKLTMTAFVIRVNSFYLVAIRGAPRIFHWEGDDVWLYIICV